MGNMYDAHDWLEKFYAHLLMYSEEGKLAKDYLNNRGITEETIKEFNLGYSPSKARITLEFLKKKDFSYTDLVNGGVLYRYDKGNLTDPLKGRVIFPIQDFQNRTVAFGGRTLDSDNKVKYINSADTKIYKKGDNLFGFNLAKEEIQNQGYAVLLEGYFDVMVAHQSNIKNTIAALGTAITFNQALLIRDVTSNVVIAYDGDSAGIESSFRTASVLENVGCNVRIAQIDNELDPDDFIKEYGGDAFIKEVILNASNVEDSFILSKKKQKGIKCPTSRYSVVSDSLDQLKKNNIDEQKNLLVKLGNTLNISIEDIYKIIERRSSE